MNKHNLLILVPLLLLTGCSTINVTLDHPTPTKLPFCEESKPVSLTITGGTALHLGGAPNGSGYRVHTQVAYRPIFAATVAEQLRHAGFVIQDQADTAIFINIRQFNVNWSKGKMVKVKAQSVLELHVTRKHRTIIKTTLTEEVSQIANKGGRKALPMGRDCIKKLADKCLNNLFMSPELKSAFIPREEQHFYPDNQLKEKFMMLGTNKDGAYEAFHPGGATKDLGQYNLDSKQGTWTHFAENSTRTELSNWELDIQHGSWQQWLTDGTPVVSGQYAQGQQDGCWIGYHSNGQKKYERNWNNGVMHGIWREWCEDGSIESEQHYEEGYLQGISRQYYPSGRPKSEISYKQGQLHGPKTVWFDNDQVNEKSEFLNGEKNGVWLFWNGSGVKIHQQAWDKGFKNGKWKEWFTNKQLKSEGNYTKNLMDGTWKTWHHNGNQESVTEWQGHAKEGESLHWHSNGNLKTSGSFANNIKYGFHASWWENGNRQKEEYYNAQGQWHGSFRTWFNNGQLSRSGTLRMGEPVGQWFVWKESTQTEMPDTRDALEHLTQYLKIKRLQKELQK